MRRDVANEMDAEDGLLWVYGVGDDGGMAFTDFGTENLMELSSGSTSKTQSFSRLKISNPLRPQLMPNGYLL